MSVLFKYWEEYRLIEKSGMGRTERCLELESLIHARQKEVKQPPYDFDKHWRKINSMAKPTVSGPPAFDSVPASETVVEPETIFTFEQAKTHIGENDCAILDYCMKEADAYMVYLAHIADMINPENKNVARRGQAINLAIRIFDKMKENGETLDDTES